MGTEITLIAKASKAITAPTSVPTSGADLSHMSEGKWVDPPVISKQIKAILLTRAARAG